MATRYVVEIFSAGTAAMLTARAAWAGGPGQYSFLITK